MTLWNQFKRFSHTSNAAWYQTFSPAAWVIILSLFFIVPRSLVFASSDTIFKEVSPLESAQLIQANQEHADFVILDVRTPDEFRQGHLREAVLLNFYSRTFAADLEKLDKQKTYLIYCHSGVRSGKTLSMMREKGVQRIYHLREGVLGWRNASLPLTQ